MSRAGAGKGKLERERAQTEAAVQEQAERLFQRYGGNSEALATVAAQYYLASREQRSDSIEVASLVAPDGSPKVDIRVGEGRVQVAPQEAREAALLILEAGEAALQDAALFAFAQSGDGDLGTASALVSAVRSYRRDRWKVEAEQAKDEPDG